MTKWKGKKTLQALSICGRCVNVYFIFCISYFVFRILYFVFWLCFQAPTLTWTPIVHSCAYFSLWGPFHLIQLPFLFLLYVSHFFFSFLFLLFLLHLVHLVLLLARTKWGYKRKLNCVWEKEKVRRRDHWSILNCCSSFFFLSHFAFPVLLVVEKKHKYG